MKHESGERYIPNKYELTTTLLLPENVIINMSWHQKYDEDHADLNDRVPITNMYQCSSRLFYSISVTTSMYIIVKSE